MAGEAKGGANKGERGAVAMATWAASSFHLGSTFDSRGQIGRHLPIPPRIPKKDRVARKARWNMKNAIRGGDEEIMALHSQFVGPVSF